MKKATKLNLIPISLGLLFSSAAARADWQPLLGDPATTSLLNFDGGLSDLATAALPAAPSMAFPTLGTGITSSSSPASATSGGWHLVTAGGVAAYSTGTDVASALASATTSAGSLEFNALTTGVLGNLASVDLPSTWSATASIPGASAWGSPANEFLYRFDLGLNSSLLSLTPGVLPAIGLLIEDGTGSELYRADNLGQLLGITDLTTENFADVGIPFIFDPANGPLNIFWFGSALVTAGLLNNGVTNILTVSDSSVLAQSAVPEVSTIGLTGLAGALLLQRRRRRC